MNGIQEASSSGEGKAESHLSKEHEELLEKVASSDFADYDWNDLRRVVKQKLDANVTEYLSDVPQPSPVSSQPSASPETQPPGGLKLPPFAPRPPADFASARVGLNSLGHQKSVLTKDEAQEMKDSIFSLMDDFEQPPFTIQRLCELSINPRHHYKTSGKYLRAVERALLVTSSTDAFPIIPPEELDQPSPSISYSPTGSLREATTPLFSPIPFLHEDARRSRSRSRSPPMSPLDLASRRPTSPGGTSLGAIAAIEPITLDAVLADGTVVVDGPVIGLVDELDDPSPGHMSDHPTALSATTTTADAPTTETVESKPIFGSLEDRFVKSTESEGAADANSGTQGDEMMVDEAEEDKENINKA